MTKKTDVTGEISIWALPNHNAKEGEQPFTYVLRDEHGSPWQDGAVKVNTLPVTLTVPEGLNLIQKAIERIAGVRVWGHRAGRPVPSP